MKHLKLASVAFFSGLLLLSFTKISIEKTPLEGLGIGQKAPMTVVDMPNIDNNLLTLEKLKGQNGLLVVFSCNTCPFVVGNENFAGWEKQYNELQVVAEKAAIGMVLINSNEAKRGDDDSFEAMQKHAKDLAYTMPYLLDKNAAMANAFGAKTTPHVYLLDQDLKLIYQGAIDNTWDPNRKSDILHLKSAIANVVNGEIVKENTTSPKGCSIKRVKN